MSRSFTIFLIVAIALALSLSAQFWLPWLEIFFQLNDGMMQSISAWKDVFISGVAALIALYQWLRPPPHKNPALLTDWLRDVAVECGNMPLAAIAPQLNKDRAQMNALYTDLDVFNAPEGEETARSWVLGHGKQRQERVGVLDALAQHRLAVLLGEPGAGKSTVTQYLALHLAQAEAEKKAVNLGNPVWERCLPVRLILRDMALAGKGACLLWDGVRQDMCQRLGKANGDALFLQCQDTLRQRGVFILDGLDESPQRQTLLDAASALAQELQNGARVVITARPWAYADDMHLTGWPVLMLAPLSSEQTARFCQRWYAAWRDQFTAQQAEARTETLVTALAARNDLDDIASRPLLLTLICALHIRDARLPEDRADLYQDALRLLLFRWQQKLNTRVLPEAVKLLLQNNDARLLAGLEQLAFRTHARQQHEQTLPEAQRAQRASADIPEHEVLGLFARLLDQACPPTGISEFLELRAGLLIARGNGYFSFVHRTFQEFLAAGYVVHRKADSATCAQVENDSALCLGDGLQDALGALARSDLNWWKEVVLLALSKAYQGNQQNIASHLNELLPDLPTQDWQLVRAVGLVLVETGITPHDGKTARTVVQRARDALAELVAGGQLSIRDRAEAGDALGALGDPRPGVGLDANGLPDIVWQDIPADNYLVGEDEDERRISLEKFAISRYPVTNAQYRAFVDADGYAEPRWWGGTDSAGWAWRQEDESHALPEDWHNTRWNRPNRPVVGVSWFEAQAFCAWLSVQRGETIELPSEWQWEAAARGTDGRRYPWGNVWRDDAANSDAAGLATTSTVGLFPASISPLGVLDCSGNVWEWTASAWEQGKNGVGDFLSKIHANLNGPRVIRGGSWLYFPSRLRSSFRYDGGPSDRYSDVGFRLARMF